MNDAAQNIGLDSYETCSIVMSPMKIVGIDPGACGGISSISTDQKDLSYCAMPVIGKEIDVNTIVNFLMQDAPQMVYIEHSQAIHKMSARSMFSFGKNFGILIGIVSAMKLPFCLVKPKVWQKAMFVGTDTSDKPKSRAACAAYRLFPEHDFKASQRCKKEHDGIVDATLIAEYGRRVWMGRNTFQ